VKLRPLLANLALLAGVTLVCLLLAEVGVRVAGLDRPPDPELSGAHTYDSLLGWRNTPSRTARITTGEYDITETFNAHSIRGPELAIPKPRGVRRILLLGDSFVEAYTVGEDSTAAADLERIENAHAPPAVEVINGGTAGYSTDQELLAYESMYRAFQPDVVVLLFYVNDVMYNVRDRYWRGYKPLFRLAGDSLVLTNVPVPPPQPAEYAFRVEGGHGLVGLVRRGDAWLGRTSALYRLVRQVLRTTPMLSGLLTKLGFNAVPGEFLPWKTTPDSTLAGAWRVTDALLVRLRDEVERDGARFVVFHVPSRPAIYDDDWRRTRETYAFAEDAWSPRQDAVDLAAVCERRHLRCILPEPIFRREAERLAPAGGRLYWERDAHWTAAGNALAARIIADTLAAAPAEPPPAGRASRRAAR